MELNENTQCHYNAIYNNCRLSFSVLEVWVLRTLDSKPFISILDYLLGLTNAGTTSLNATCTARSEYSPCTNALSGDLSSRWISFAGSGQWIRITLPQPYVVQAMGIVPSKYLTEQCLNYRFDMDNGYHGDVSTNMLGIRLYCHLDVIITAKNYYQLPWLITFGARILTFISFEYLSYT